MCLPVERFRVISRKSTHFLLASIVIFRPCSLEIAHRSFLVNSTWRGDPLMIPRPSSRYNPKLLPYFWVILCRRNEPTSSQDSTPS